MLLAAAAEQNHTHTQSQNTIPLTMVGLRYAATRVQFYLTTQRKPVLKESLILLITAECLVSLGLNTQGASKTSTQNTTIYGYKLQC